VVFNQSIKLFSTDNLSNTINVKGKEDIVSFYKKPLPLHLISFSSPEGKLLFKEALQEKAMESYWTLAEQFHTQSEPAYCGLAALAMVLNALQIDPKRLWKSPWRWFNEDLLDCCTPLEIVKKEGITFNEFACLAKCNGAEVESFRVEESSETIFRKHIQEVCSSEGSYLVVNFSRSILGQTGDGHFSPISGYHVEKDLVLVMDTAKFKYPAFWCPVALLYDAMKPHDSRTSHSRGYFILRRDNKSNSTSQLPILSITSSSSSSSSSIPYKTNWSAVSHHLTHLLPYVLKESKPSTVEDVLASIIRYLPRELSVSIVTECNQTVEQFREIFSASKLHFLLLNVLHKTSVNDNNFLSKIIDNTTGINTTTTINTTNDTIDTRTTSSSASNDRIASSNTISSSSPICSHNTIQMRTTQVVPERNNEERDVYSDEEILGSELLTMLVLSAPSRLFRELSPELRLEFKELRSLDKFPIELSKQITRMRFNMLDWEKQCTCKETITTATTIPTPSSSSSSSSSST